MLSSEMEEYLFASERLCYPDGPVLGDGNHPSVISNSM
jgi:hypothetical protein